MSIPPREHTFTPIALAVFADDAIVAQPSMRRIKLSNLRPVHEQDELAGEPAKWMKVSLNVPTVENHIGPPRASLSLGTTWASLSKNSKFACAFGLD